MSILSKTTDNALVRDRGVKKTNTELKAKVVQEEEGEQKCCPEDTQYAYHDTTAGCR